MSHPDDSSPFNPLPPVVVVLFLAVVIPEIAFFLGSKGLIGGPQAVGWRQAAIQQYGFSGDLMRWMIANGVYPPEMLVRVITYPFLHGGFSQMLFAAALLLARRRRRVGLVAPGRAREERRRGGDDLRKRRRRRRGGRATRGRDDARGGLRRRSRRARRERRRRRREHRGGAVVRLERRPTRADLK